MTSEDIKHQLIGHKAKDITPSMAWRREAWEAEALGDPSFKGRERAIVSQANTGAVSKEILRKLLRDGIGGFPSA